MKKIRIGNTILAKWTIKVNGQPYPLEGLELNLTMTLPNGAIVPVPFTIEETNKIYYYFQGKDQKQLGRYRLTLWQNEDNDNQHVVDACDAWSLVSCSCKSDDGETANLELEVVELEGNLEVGEDSQIKAVLYKPQTLTEAEKAQARENIGVQDAEPCDIYVVDVNDAPSAEMISHTITKVITDASGLAFITFIPNPELGLNEALYQNSDGWRIINGDDETQFDDFDTYGALFLWADEHSSPIATKDITDALELRVSNAEANINAVESIASGKQDRLVSGTNIKTINGESVLGSGDIEIDVEGAVRYDESQSLTDEQKAQARANINAKKGGYTRIEKLHDYIHEIWYDGVDYSFADLLPHTPLGACTSIRKGKFFARNLDWQYSECCEFFVHTPAVNGRHAVDGFGGNIPALTKSVVESGEWNAAYNWLPLSIADGHNDAGLCCSMNVVPTKTAPNTYERTTGTNPTKPTLNGLMIVRYILDNHIDALAAAEDIRDNWNVVMPHTDNFDEELHFLIADKTKTIVLEFVGNEAKIIQKADQEGYITNFRLNGVDWTDWQAIYDTIEPFGQGFERYGLINQAITTPTDIYEAIGFISQLWYTHAYTIEGVNAWRTDFAGLHDELTVQAAITTPSVYDATLAAAHQAYIDRTRDGQTWQTTHSVVYDMESGECLFLVQQDWTTLTRRDMALPIDAYTKAETDALLGHKVDNTTFLEGISSLDRKKQNFISDLSDIRSGASAGATAVQPDDLPTFGNIVTHNADEFLPSTTEIPSKTSDLTNDSGFITSADIADKADKYVTQSKAETALSLAINATTFPKPTILTYGTLTAFELTEVTTITNEVVITFSVGATAISITIPSGAKYVGDLTTKANESYVMSILDGVVIMSNYKSQV